VDRSRTDCGGLGQVHHARQRPGGLIITILLGIGGAVVGGFIGTQLGFGDISGLDLRSLAIAVGGGVLLLFVYRLLT
jgi:uncharacterized membrane protein YeaQ/YmgE (transglycosylase-associated protein family)